MALLALATLPMTRTNVLFQALAATTCALGVRAYRAGRTARPIGVLALLALLGVMFVAVLPARPTDVPFRLLQVAAVAFAGAGVFAALLHWRWNVSPRAALVAALAICAEIVLIEAAVGTTHANVDERIAVRPAWVGLHSVDSARTSDSLQAMSPAWSDTAATDEQLGIRFRPNSSINTLYPDNPRGYFTRGDFRLVGWELGVEAGSKAELKPQAEPGAIRIEIGATVRTAPEWHIRWDQYGLPLAGAQVHRLNFRARADQPRSIVVAVTQGGGTFGPLGLYETVQLTPQWQAYQLFFTPPLDDRNGRIHFALGGHAPSVDLADIAVTNESTGNPVVPYGARHPWVVNYRFNAVGCRGNVAPDPQPDERRILVLGEGVATGVGVHESDAFATRLMSILNADTATVRHPVRVMNCGVPGYGTREAEQLFDRLVVFKPHVVVLMVDRDADRHHWEVAQRAIRGLPRTRAEQLFFTWSAVRRLRLSRRTYDYAPSLADLARLRSAVAQQGGRLVVVMAPTDGPGELDQLRSALESGLRGSGVMIIDAGDRLPQNRASPDTGVQSTDRHPDERLHALIASRLAPELSRVLYEGAGAAAGPR